MIFVAQVVSLVERTPPLTLVLLLTLLLLSALYAYKKLTEETHKNSPPHIPSLIPFLGHSISFAKDPISFLLWAHKKYGEVFSFTMVGKTFTYLVGPNASAVFFNSKNSDLNAEEVYSKLVTPVFGKGVAYDVPNSIFLEQKKMLKAGLTLAHFRRYTPMVEKETQEYFKRWGDEGEKDLFLALSELIILTASRCLHGPEIRSRLDEHVAQLYADLDGGFSHEAWLLPTWVPLPSFKRRDRANAEMKAIFTEVIKKRRQGREEGEGEGEGEGEEEDEDLLQRLLESHYKDGRPLTDDEIAGLLIGFLLAGQHTSSTTSAWMGFFLARHKALQDSLYQEQLKVCGEDLPPLELDQLKELVQLDRCLKETLRLRPPIMTMMRMAKTPQSVNGYTIPPGHQVCVSPTVNQRLQEVWRDAAEFNPDSWAHSALLPGTFRFLQAELDNSDKFSYVPFGAGRHRCVGESFAFMQIKTIWSVLLRKYEFDLVDGYFPVVNYSTMIHTPTKTIIRYKRRENGYLQ